MTQGLGTVGQRSGRDVDFQYFGSVNGIYDTGLSPFTLDTDGKLLKPDPVWGVELAYGAYGRHNFRRSLIGLDYSGNYRKYSGITFLDGNNQNLAFQYSVQASRRWLLDTRIDTGTQVFGTAFGPAFPNSGDPVDSTSMLFDNRTSYISGSVNATYLLSSRTAVTMSGNGSKVDRAAAQLAGTIGYSAGASVRHQLSRDLFVSVSYQHTHFEFTRQYGNSSTNSYMMSFTKKFGRTWSASAGGGAFMSSVTALQLIPLPPELQEILGIPALPVVLNRDNVVPMFQLSLAKQLRRSSFSVGASRIITPGNGLYLTSRQDSVGGGYSYTGFRNMSVSFSAGWNRLNSLGQSLNPFLQFNAGANLSYNLGRGLNLTAMYGFRHQDVITGNYLNTSSRVMFGIAYSPKGIPISFH